MHRSRIGIVLIDRREDSHDAFAEHAVTWG